MPDTSPRIAVIGAGAAGIAAAYTARDRADVVLFEAGGDPGGHAASYTVEPGIGADTGFVVFNKPNYPRLSAFFDELGVETVPHSGRFTFFDRARDLVYGSPELEGDEPPADPMLAEIFAESARLATEGRRDFIRGKADVPLRTYLDDHGYSRTFQAEYITLLGTAVWSAPPDLIWEMPASTVIAYFLAHGGSGLGGRGVAWQTVRGGSRRYVDAAITASGAELRLKTTVASVAHDADGVLVTCADSGPERFDGVVVATHGDTARELLRTPSEGQRRVLEDLRYSEARIVLHTDTDVLPADRERWSSWNYGSAPGQDGPQPYVAWYLNVLQGFESDTDYVVTMNYPGQIAADRVIADVRYRHPIIDLGLRRLQPEIYRLANTSQVTLAGSYFHSADLGWDVIGSHEAAHASGVRAMRHLLGDPPSGS
ncbi:FAD-dependent oxidoreductase [Myceligenerans indicum]|uniref:NAD(P)-binding protein n=1 Tax=Myceligenerans indicum TaxID=2593663 RepID=A0ABS1LMJ4_9MICO|nr:FAD-dependent oxidoreductase [Myceligenerans indicum]MBL0887457.1 NAD(P)-binding protein [Myceligenerans indicum]